MEYSILKTDKFSPNVRIKADMTKINQQDGIRKGTKNTYRSSSSIESRRPWSFAVIEVILVLRCRGEWGMAGRGSDHQEERW